MTPEVEKVSGELAQELERSGTVAVINGVAIDPDTGEILDGLSVDQAEWIAMQYVAAKQNIKGWEQTQAILKQAAHRLIAQSGAARIKTSWGTIGERNGRQTVNLDEVRAVIAEREIGPEEELAFWRAAVSTLNTKAVQDAFTALELYDELPRVVKAGDSYIQVDPPRGAPNMEVRER